MFYRKILQFFIISCCCSFIHSKNNVNSYLSEQEYKIAFQILNRCSNQADFTVEIIKKNVLPKLVNKNNFLDIGAGPGNITKQVSSYFNNTFVIEPNSEFRKFYYREKYFVYPIPFQDFFSKKRFDFCLVSHVLYHFSIDENYQI